MKKRLFQGVSRARTGERLRLLEAERIAKQMALMAECDKRLAEHTLGLCDCSDIRVFGGKLRWCRAQGHLLVVVEIWVEPALEVYVYKWRLAGTR
jgi:hypothetical protein